MSVRVTAVLVQGVTTPPGQAFTIKNPVTDAVIASGTSDGSTGAFSVSVPYLMPLEARATPGAAAAANATVGTSSAVSLLAVAACGATTAGNATVTGGGGTPLLPPNPNFDTAFTYNVEQPNEWWAISGPGVWNVGVAIAGRHASTEMTGGYVGRLFAQAAYYDSDPDFGWSIADANLCFRRTRAEIDATSGVLTFDLRPKAKSADAGDYAVITIVAYDAGSAAVSDQENGRHTMWLWGSGPGASADTTTVGATAVNVTQTVTFDLKSWVSGRLAAGKTWADVAKVVVAFNTVSTTGSINELYIDNFR